MKYWLCILMMVSLAGCSTDDDDSVPEGPQEPDPVDERVYNPETSLKESAGFPVGLATQSWYNSDNAYDEIAGKEFNSFTAEYQMKQNITNPDEGYFFCDESDDIVSFAKSKSARVHGHALLWHSATPDWVSNYSGDSASFEALIQEYIHTVVGRYKDDVASWDVVNEAFADGTGALRNTIFRQFMGDDYIARCFQYAREVDPDVLLFYNDYGAIWDNNKLQAILALIDDFQDRGIPIDGFGFQMHIRHDWPALENIQAAVDAVAATGLQVHFSELDIRVNESGALEDLSLELAQAQQQRYREIVELYETIPDNQQFGITVWGLRDPNSWLIPFWGQDDWPLLFNATYEYKIAHKGFIEGLNK